MNPFRAPTYTLPDTEAELRRDIRALLDAHRPGWDIVARANCWATNSKEFSKALGDAGFVGMTWPKRYGGHERSMLERYIILEELLAAGAPVGAHWIADRQTGPLLLRYGTEEQREKYLPAMAAGTSFACIGLSEPGSGSDLASVRTNARRTPEGWRVNGQKIWTSNAHIATAMLALVRTEAGSERQAGLSQLLIDLKLPGITIKPIHDMSGASDFNEVFFDDVLVPQGALVGSEGQGWQQVTAELALERSGPERYLSSHALLEAVIDYAGKDPAEPLRSTIGRLTADLWVLRQMSLATAARLAAGEDPMIEAAIVKDLGNSFEQALPVAIQQAVEIDLSGTGELPRLLSHLLLASPSFSLRGGTREILRGIIARGMGLR